MTMATDPADRLSHQHERPGDAGSQAVSDQVQRLLTRLEEADAPA
jgi:hypothetical protein